MKKRYYVYLMYLLVVSLVVTYVSFSRFRTTVEGSSQVTIAKPVLEYIPTSLMLNGISIPSFSEGINLTDIMPGDVLIYRFDIKNYNENVQNQVLLKYMTTVVFDPIETTLPLTYNLSPDGIYPSAGGNWVYLGFGMEITHSYTLTVSWEEEEINPIYTNQEQSIQIQINSQQEDSSI